MINENPHARKAACRLEPILLGSDFSHLLKAEKLYIVSFESISGTPNQPAQPCTSNDQTGTICLSVCQTECRERSFNHLLSMIRYLAIVRQGETSVSALEYWSINQNAYTKLVPGQDLLRAPASQAYHNHNHNEVICIAPLTIMDSGAEHVIS